MPLIDKPLFVHLFKRPKLAFDIVVVIGDIWVLHIDKIAKALGYVFPNLFILPNAGLAILDKLFNAILFNVLLTVKAFGFFNLNLNRQTMRVPPGLARNKIPLHGFKARDNVFHRAGKRVADMRFAIRCWRPLIERKHLAAAIFVHRLLKNLILFPKAHNFKFARNKI